MEPRGRQRCSARLARDPVCRPRPCCSRSALSTIGPGKRSAFMVKTPQAPPAPPGAPEARRSFLRGLAAGVIGTLVGLVPVASGLFVFLDPLLRRRGGAAALLKVTALDAVPADGM